LTIYISTAFFPSKLKTLFFLNIRVNNPLNSFSSKFFPEIT
jgi:hypothetical protein